MGIISNTVSICQFKVVGNVPDTDIFEWGSERLARNKFIPIDNTTEEFSHGWVHMDDPKENSFSVPQDFWRDNYLALTLRRDRRKIPAILFKARLKEAEIDFLTANPGYKYVPKQKREDIKDALRSSLFAKTLPFPSIYDAVWDTKTGLLTFTSLSTKVIELFEDHFKKTFEGLSLKFIHPFSRAMELLDESCRQKLQKANGSSADSVLSLIKHNLWLGRDFLLWLIYMTINESSEYKVNKPGHFLNSEPFTAFLDDRLILMDSNDGGQKITVSGPQNHFMEVRTALKEGKQITEATIFMERQEESWNLTLKGDLFQFASYKCPNVKMEKDELTNESDEKEAVFYERMFLLEKGLQLFDSVYTAFLSERLSREWINKEKKIKEWFTI